MKRLIVEIDLEPIGNKPLTMKGVIQKLSAAEAVAETVISSRR